MRLLSERITVVLLICSTQGVSPYTHSTDLSQNHRHHWQTTRRVGPLLHPSAHPQRRRRRQTTNLNVVKQGFGDFDPLNILGSRDDTENVVICKDRIVRLYDFCASKPIPYQTMWTMQKNLVEGHMGRLAKKQHKHQIPESQFFSKTESFPSAQQQNDDQREGRDSIIFVQHEPVYTLGTGSDESFIKGHDGTTKKKEIDIVRIERGGEVTYHGPGQLVAYPILDLRGYRMDLHWYMRALEEAVIIALTNVGLKGVTREDDVTGVWVNQKKIAAMGVKVKRWVTMHGLAVNVDHRSLDNFDGIVPCGLVGREVCCINDFLEEPITVEDFALQLKEALEIVLEVELKLNLP